MEYGLRSSPDGYTLTQITPSYTINPSVRPVKFDALTDYTPIVMEGKGPPGGARTSFAACAQRTPIDCVLVTKNGDEKKLIRARCR
jgi:hypothetical protein